MPIVCDDRRDQVLASKNEVVGCKGPQGGFRFPPSSFRRHQAKRGAGPFPRTCVWVSSLCANKDERIATIGDHELLTRP